MSRVIVPFCLVVIGIAAYALTARGGNILSDDPYDLTYVRLSNLGVLQDTLPPIKDRYEDFLNTKKTNPFDLKDPNNVEQTVEYDPITGRYIIQEKIGDDYFRPPTYMTFDEYMEYRRKQDEARYFKELSGVSTGDGVSATDPLAKIDVKNSLIDRLFGGNTVDIRPQGNIDLTFGLDYQKVENPILPIRNQSQLNFDFDMAIQMNVTGKIGEKLSLSTQYNTQSTFNFDNQIKLNYNSDLFSEDEILKKIEAGNVSLPLRGTLIQGAQSLFGIKTEMQFGHLRLTTVLSQQQSQRENIQLQGGSQLQEFEVRADDYDENRHFFLSHYNRDVFEGALTNLPQLKTLFKIENLEVWITNNRNEVENVRDIVALADLGEPQDLVSPEIISPTPDPTRFDISTPPIPLPDNNANDLYRNIVGDPAKRSIDQAVSKLQSLGLQQAKDFEKVSARKLQPSEYTYHPELGFISLNVNVQPDQVVGVSYQYSYNGRIYKVGELAQNQEVTGTRDSRPEVPRDTLSDLKVLFVKMLKSTTQRTDVPTWDLMMKNVYSIGAFNVNPQEFRLNVFYDDPGRGYKRFLSDVETYATNDTVPGSPVDRSAPLLRVFNLDQLNTQGDPQPDGIFDFVPGITINLRNGRVMFPVLEPFGSSLKRKLVNPRDEQKFLYQELYDSTIFLAREFPEKNRFLIKGSYKSSVASEISLGAFNIPPGSVRVTAGGQQLIEGADYEIDYNIGRVRILNDALLSAGVPINVSYEDNTLFNFNNKTMVGLRADYQVDENFNIGATYMHLFERPFTQKVNIGDDPINNRIYGLDLNLTRNAPFLTKLVDAIPGINTKAESKISVTAEAAALRPGHSRAINQNRDDDQGLVYLDDFEGSASSFDLRQPVNQWYLSSVPQNAIHPVTRRRMFPEADLINDLRSGANRARLNWYLIDDSRNASVRVRNQQDFNNPYTAIIQQTEVFPNLVQTPDQLPTIQTMSMTYYPRERGPYNFDVPNGNPNYSRGVTFLGDSLVLRDPETRWGGIMKALQTNDFQAANIEFLEFWVMSPFLSETTPNAPAENYESRQGELFINLGNISEDILRDSRKFFENGLPAPTNPDRRVDSTRWSVIPSGQQITRAFDLEAGSREVQDVGYDGLNNEGERSKFGTYLADINTANPRAGARIAQDPSNDDYRYYRDPSYPDDAGVFRRYRDFNNPEGNSRENDGSQFVSSATNVPDAEDINRDNTLNETESYFQYRIPFVADPTDPRRIDVKQTPYITDVRDTLGRIWYRFRVPLNGPDKVAVGGIRDFRSIRFIRMFMTGFRDQTTLRFATLELVRNQWRTYTKELPSSDIGIDNCEEATVLNVDAVNIEENSGRKPFNYVLPRDIQREQSLGVFNALQNEQSLAMSVNNLCDGASRAVFKTLNFDMRVYDRLKMFVHAEDGDTLNSLPIPDGALSVFIRLGSDILENYYEYEIPLTMSREERLSGNPNSDGYKNEVWRPENNFDVDLKKLVKIKEERNDPSRNFPFNEEYTKPDTVNIDLGGGVIIRRPGTIKVRGNPNLGNVKIAMIGVRNPANFDGAAYDVVVWANELRLSGLDERGGAAAVARVDMQLADFGTMTLAGNISTIGFGALDQKVQERSRQEILGYDFATTLELGKFFPDRWGIRLPFFAQLSNLTKTPEFDPYDFDVTVRDKYRNTPEVEVIRDSDTTILRKQDVQDITNIRSFNFTNVRKERTSEGGGGKPKPWDIENFSVSYAFTETTRRDPIIEFDERKRHTGGLDYAFSRNVKYIEPFKEIKSDKFLGLLKQFNFNPFPNSFGFSTVLDRRFDRTRYRFTGYENEDDINKFATFYNKRFTWDRNYNLQWDLSRSLKLNFNAVANAVIDEPEEIDLYRDLEAQRITDINQARRDSIWQNIMNLGRTKNYTHSINASYQLPIRYLPFMDWIQARANYQAEYGWNAAALNMIDDQGVFLGNVIRNSQNRQFSADFNFASLYSKINYLKKIDTPQRNQQRNQPGQRTRTRDNNQPQTDDPQ
ncbi:MAG: cell surface protein SprA, partial [Saprospiraceae bacterium]